MNIQLVILHWETRNFRVIARVGIVSTERKQRSVEVEEMKTKKKIAGFERANERIFLILKFWAKNKISCFILLSASVSSLLATPPPFITVTDRITTNEYLYINDEVLTMSSILIQTLPYFKVIMRPYKNSESLTIRVAAVLKASNCSY